MECVLCNINISCETTHSALCAADNTTLHDHCKQASTPRTKRTFLSAPWSSCAAADAVHHATSKRDHSDEELLANQCTLKIKTVHTVQGTTGIVRTEENRTNHDTKDSQRDDNTVSTLGSLLQPTTDRTRLGEALFQRTPRLMSHRTWVHDASANVDHLGHCDDNAVRRTSLETRKPTSDQDLRNSAG